MLREDFACKYKKCFAYLVLRISTASKIMQSLNFDTPRIFAVLPNNKKAFSEGYNHVFWLNQVRQTIEITRLEKRTDKVLAKAPNGSVYTILPHKSKNNEKGFIIVSNQKTLHDVWRCLQSGQIKLTWKSFRGVETVPEVPNAVEARSVIQSIGDKQRLKTEIVDDDDNIVEKGLRPPQIGSIYAILSNWAISNDILTVVLPTGTGKSEAILGTIITAKITRSLIIVPSDGLREQFSKNCRNWGILRIIDIVDETVLNPVVLKVASSPKDENVFQDMLAGSNIIIATSAILNQLTPVMLAKIADMSEAIFIDEAHHGAAPSWEFLKSKFTAKRVIQFTATPFREDKKPIGGKIVFNYSMAQAQQNRYFTKIDFVPVVDYDSDNWDKTISEKAIELLRKDVADGLNHFLMARVDHIGKAKEVFYKYYQQYTEFSPVLITSKSPDVAGKIEQLRKGQSRIVVCVNMLGEGIDIPELKIAALHDIRKSLTVTLQLVGRFTRSSKSKAPAKIIANIADVKIEKRLKELYKEDADWGKLIAFASAKEIQQKIKFQELLANFKESKIPIFNIKPKLSAVVYKTNGKEWTPEKLHGYFEKEELLYLYDINQDDKMAIAIYQEEKNIDWLDSEVFFESTWQLLLFYFDSERQLLYVNSSEKNAEMEVVGRMAGIKERIESEEPFKCYFGLGYVVLFTLGLDKNTDSPIKYAMYAGDDVYTGISDMEKNHSSKNNTYGYGFDEGMETTMGASKKGKIWSRLVGNLQEWKDWCDVLGNKLLNPSIDVNEIFKGFLQPRRFDLSSFGKISDPISVDWPGLFYQDNETVQYFIIDSLYKQVFEITLFITKNTNGYKIHLITDAGTKYLNIVYAADGFTWEPEGFTEIKYGRKNKQLDFIDYLRHEDTFKIRLQDGTFIENNYHFKPYNQLAVFPLDGQYLTAFDWTGVDTSKESMGYVPPLADDSIQYRIWQVKEANPLFQVIINDDDPGEAADLICIGEMNDTLFIEAVHCKFMLNKNSPGTRVGDFYELCCQAQKTIKNFSNVNRLFDHIRARETRTAKAGYTRFLKGDLRTLELLIKTYSYKRPKFKVTLVQPALDKTKASKNILELLGSTHTLLQETINAQFEVICS
jgi:superfamily II DNA or RNA helicase